MQFNIIRINLNSSIKCFFHKFYKMQITNNDNFVNVPGT